MAARLVELEKHTTRVFLAIGDCKKHESKSSCDNEKQCGFPCLLIVVAKSTSCKIESIYDLRLS